MSETPGIGHGPRYIEPSSQSGPQTVGESGRPDRVGTGIINFRITSSHIEMRGGVIPNQTHGIAPPGPGAAEGMRELGSVVATDFNSSVDALTLVKTLMTKLHATLADLREDEHGLMKDARQSYSKSVDKKVNNMHRQADAAMGFGISSAVVGGAFSVGSTVCAFRGAAGQQQLVMARTQSLSGLGQGFSGILDAVGKGVDINLEARNAKLDKFAQLYQSFQAEFKEAVESAKQGMQGANSALSEAGSKDDATMGVMIRNLG